jgi:hypothetical protein
MRPQSILMFERLFLASLAGSVLGFALTYDEIVGTLANDPALQEVGLGSGFVFGITAASLAIYLLLWHLIAHKAANFAKWILVAFTAIGVLMAVPSMAGPWDTMQLLSLAVYVLQIAAVVYLFRADAVAWLKGDGPADPAAFD